MRYRIGTASQTCLGRRPGTDFGLDNNVEENELLLEIREDFIKQFDSEEKGYKLGGYDWCDFGWLTDTIFVVGLEPSYQWQRLLVFQFNFESKEESMVLRGTAFGYYGTNIAMKTKKLKDYKRKGKHAAFIEKWWDKLYDIRKLIRQN